MKVSVEFAQEQLDRARQILSSGSRKLIGKADIGSVVVLAVIGRGNMLQSRPAMIYNLKATTEQRALEAKAALKTSTFMAAIAELEEEGVRAHVQGILNAATVAFTVPLSSGVTFNDGDLVKAKIEEYQVPATEQRAGYSSIGVNNVTHVKPTEARSASTIFGNWDDEEETILEDNPTTSTPAPEEDAFAQADNALKTGATA